MFWDRHRDVAGWWPMGIGLIILALVIGLLVWLVVRVINRRSGSGGSAEELLRHRFAAGEIDAEEYAQRLELLRRR